MSDDSRQPALGGLPVLARMMARRMANRMLFGIRFGKKPAAGERQGTASKQAGVGVIAMLVWLCLLFQSFNINSMALRNLAGTTDRMVADPTLITIPDYHLRSIQNEERNLKSEDRPEFRKLYRQSVARTFRTIADREMISEREADEVADRMDRAFDERGSAAFRAEHTGALYFGSESDWPEPAAEPAFLRNVAAFFALGVAALVCTALGIGNKDLGAVDWSFEWLYTFPVSSRTLFLTRLLAATFLNPFAWGFVGPLCLLFYYASGFGLATIPMAAFATLYVAAIAGMIVVLTEVAGRKVLGLTRLKNVQALCTLTGAVAMLGYLSLMREGPVSRALVRFANEVVPLSLLNPFACPALMAEHGLSAGRGALALGGMTALILAGGGLTLALCERMTRDGLMANAAAVQGGRGRSAVVPDTERRFKGVVMNELLLLLRDRNFAIQVLVLPLIGIGFYVYTQKGILNALSGNIRHGTAVAFGVGAYVLTSSAMSMLVREKSTLWLLLTFPRALSRIFVEKTFVWAGFAALYTATAIVGLACFRHEPPTAELAIDAFFAIGGVIVFAFIAGGIGIMAHRLDDTPGAPVRPNVGMMYLYMALAGMLGYTLYGDNVLAKITMTVLAALLAFALWQKAHDRLQYLLDPDAIPPRRIDLADGLIAAQAFFFIQTIAFGMITVMSKRGESPLDSVLIAYVVAGAAVVVIFSVVFWRQKVCAPAISLGLFPAPGERTPAALAKQLAYGPLYGAAAALFAAAYLRVLDVVPAWREWKDLSDLHAGSGSRDAGITIFLLAVVAAPLFEEFIFRGLVYRGLSRSLRPATAVIGSAALFALVHSPVSVIPVFGLGLAAAHVFRRTGWLAVPILAHATYNACVVFLIPR